MTRGWVRVDDEDDAVADRGVSGSANGAFSVEDDGMFSIRLAILLKDGKTSAGGAFSIGEEGPISFGFLVASLYVVIKILPPIEVNRFTAVLIGEGVREVPPTGAVGN